MGTKRKTITVEGKGTTTTYKELAESPLEKMETADQIEMRDTELVQHSFLEMHHVADGDVRKCAEFRI